MKKEVFQYWIGYSFDEHHYGYLLGTRDECYAFWTARLRSTLKPVDASSFGPIDLRKENINPDTITYENLEKQR